VSHSAKVVGSRRTRDKGDAFSNRTDDGDDSVEEKTVSQAMKSECIPTPSSNGDAPELVEADEIIVRGGGTHRELAAFSASIGDTPLFSPLASPVGDERDAFAKADAAAKAPIFVGEALASSAARLLTARSPSRRPRHSAAQNPARASASSACQTSIAWAADGRACGVRS